MAYDCTNTGQAIDEATTWTNANKSAIDEALEYYDLVKKDTITPIGFKFDETDITADVTLIDLDGEPFSPSTGFMNYHEIFNIGRCLIDPDDNNAITMGTNMRGDGLIALDGSAGDVMTRFNNVKYRYEIDGTTKYLWFAPFESNLAYFKYHPNCYQGGNTTPHKHFYWGAYEASFYLDGETPKLRSASGKQPVTGGAGYTGLPGDLFTIDNAIQYAKNKGPGWNSIQVWSQSLVQCLMYMYYQTRDIQTALGKGVCDLPSGELYAGVLTGADSIDSNLNEYGIGVGSGINGQTPICWKFENPYGNIYKWLPGINQYNSDQTTRLINPDGTGTLAGNLAVEDTILLEGLCDLTDGYYSGVFDEEYGALALIPRKIDASSSWGFADYSYYARYSPSVVPSGGAWDYGLECGPGCRAASASASDSYRRDGARLEFTEPA